MLNVQYSKRRPPDSYELVIVINFIELFCDDVSILKVSISIADKISRKSLLKTTHPMWFISHLNTVSKFTNRKNQAATPYSYSEKLVDRTHFIGIHSNFWCVDKKIVTGFP